MHSPNLSVDTVISCSYNILFLKDTNSSVLSNFAVKGYPVIDGVLNTTRVSFARFINNHSCDYGMFAVGNNPLSPDAVHSMQMVDTTKYSVDMESLAFFYEPDPGWIVQEVCMLRLVVGGGNACGTVNLSAGDCIANAIILFYLRRGAKGIIYLIIIQRAS